MAISATMEILGTKMWDMAPDLLHYHKQMIDNAILLRAQFEKDDQEDGMPHVISMADGFSEKVFVGKTTQIRYWDELGWESGDTIVSVTPVTGPIIRNGDACSYGSKNYRDVIIAASEVPGCVGHLIYIDTPGGSAYAKDDFKYAIDYVRAKGQPVIALVDGLCASAGMALASMCDEIYFVNVKDRIGCIGTMCAFYATPDGVVDAITQDRYVEVYGSKSEWKNKEYRDAAVGNYDELQREVDALNEEFWNTIRTYRPSVLEEQMHGKIYSCGEVVGTLVDGQGTMQTCIERILEKAGVQPVQASAGNGSEAGAAASDVQVQAAAPVEGALMQTEAELPGEGVQADGAVLVQQVLEPVQDDTPAAGETENMEENNNPEEGTTEEPVVPESSEEVSDSQNKERKMNEYPLIMSALGLNALAVDKEGGYYMNQALCDAMEAFIAQANQDKLTMDAKIEEVALLNAKIEELKGEHEQAMNGLNEAHAQEIEKLGGEHAQALCDLTALKDGEIAELDNQLTEAHETIEGLRTQVEEGKAEIDELSNAVQQPEVPEAPQADGIGTAEEPSQSGAVINDDMSPEEKKQALRRRNEELMKLIG